MKVLSWLIGHHKVQVVGIQPGKREKQRCKPAGTINGHFAGYKKSSYDLKQIHSATTANYLSTGSLSMMMILAPGCTVWMKSWARNRGPVSSLSLCRWLQATLSHIVDALASPVKTVAVLASPWAITRPFKCSEQCTHSGIMMYSSKQKVELSFMPRYARNVANAFLIWECYALLSYT